MIRHLVRATDHVTVHIYLQNAFRTGRAVHNICGKTISQMNNTSNNLQVTVTLLTVALNYLLKLSNSFVVNKFPFA